MKPFSYGYFVPNNRDRFQLSPLYYSRDMSKESLSINGTKRKANANESYYDKYYNLYELRLEFN